MKKYKKYFNLPFCLALISIVFIISFSSINISNDRVDDYAEKHFDPEIHYTEEGRNTFVNPYKIINSLAGIILIFGLPILSIKLSIIYFSNNIHIVNYFKSFLIPITNLVLFIASLLLYEDLPPEAVVFLFPMILITVFVFSTIAFINYLVYKSKTP